MVTELFATLTRLSAVTAGTRTTLSQESIFEFIASSTNKIQLLTLLLSSMRPTSQLMAPTSRRATQSVLAPKVEGS